MLEKVSIIVPVYKVEQYLKRCIESLIHQTYKNIELILVDDGSPDSCGGICDEYATSDNRIKVIHKKNGGLSEARNFGIDSATGNYITFVDSDDFVSENYIEYLLYLLKENNAQISICGFVKFTKEEEIIKNQPKDNPKVLSSVDALKEIYGKSGAVYIISCGKLYTRNLFESIRFPIAKLHEDEFITYKLFYYAERIVYSEQMNYYYFIRNDSITGEPFSIKKLDYIEALEKRLEFFKQNSMKILEEYTLQRYAYALVDNYCHCKLYCNADTDIMIGLRQKFKRIFLRTFLSGVMNLKNKISLVLYFFYPMLYSKRYLSKKEYLCKKTN